MSFMFRRLMQTLRSNGPAGSIERAAAPRPPSGSAPLLEAQAARKAYLAERELAERQSMLRGLIWLAVLAVAISLYRAGVDRAFYAGWWHQW